MATISEREWFGNNDAGELLKMQPETAASAPAFTPFKWQTCGRLLQFVEACRRHFHPGEPVDDSLPPYNQALYIASNWLGSDENLGRSEQARLLRCVYGNPFRTAKLDAKWRAGVSPEVVVHIQSLAACGTDGLPDNLGMMALADALKEAGCPHPEIIDHVNTPGPHSHVCWALRLLLPPA